MRTCRAHCILVTYKKTGRDGVGAGLKSSLDLISWSSCIHLEKKMPLSDWHKVPHGLDAFDIWYSLTGEHMRGCS